MNHCLRMPSLMQNPASPLRMARARAAASLGNVAVGFDILGHSVDGPADIATVTRIDSPEVIITDIRGCVTDLPTDPRRNTAGMALLALRKALGIQHGFALALDKGIPLGSGLGGSAASCVAALVAANAVLDRPLQHEALYGFAIEGEAVASGSRHGDNVGPMLTGGLALATRDRLLRIPVPAEWYCAVVHPHYVLETRKARAALERDFALHDFVRQSSHLAMVLAGCYQADAELVRDGLKDVLVEPLRASLVPHFARVKQAALDHAAMGASIAGGGPSVFGWYTRRSDAEAAADAMRQAFADGGLDSDRYVSPINGPAACLLESVCEVSA
ncbi:homoserine kinase [Frateuria aurantia]